ncbi:MAG: hypothetical protein CK536_06465 [Synechococcus sp. Baikal-G1]|nr:MAG: hypothetical protein CK536_06465 [Synechococcus sp. Baikal-G1]
MVFNRKGSFFLNLDDQAPAKAAEVAPVRAPETKAKADTTSTPVAIAVPTAAATSATPSPSTNAPAASTDLTSTGVTSTGVTTAEEIAAELRAAQEARPAQTFITFAPERVSAGGALPMARRKGGANLAGFKAMAGSLFGK